jgi:hypothetical protein
LALQQQYQGKKAYDQFIHKIQQAKMKELWANEEDDAWEKV